MLTLCIVPGAAVWSISRPVTTSNAAICWPRPVTPSKPLMYQREPQVLPYLPPVHDAAAPSADVRIRVRMRLAVKGAIWEVPAIQRVRKAFMACWSVLQVMGFWVSQAGSNMMLVLFGKGEKKLVVASRRPVVLCTQVMLLVRFCITAAPYR